jgi:hypothetical protein
MLYRSPFAADSIPGNLDMPGMPLDAATTTQELTGDTQVLLNLNSDIVQTACPLRPELGDCEACQ